MHQTDTLIAYVGLVCILVFFVLYVIKYVRYWNQLKQAFLQSGMELPFPSQEELNKEAQKSILSTQRMMWIGIIKTARIIFFMRTENPAIQKPLYGIRRCYIVFFVFPIVLAIVLTVTYVLLSGM